MAYARAFVRNSCTFERVGLLLYLVEEADAETYPTHQIFNFKFGFVLAWQQGWVTHHIPWSIL